MKVYVVYAVSDTGNWGIYFKAEDAEERCAVLNGNASGAPYWFEEDEVK